MAGNTFGKLFTITTFGESHGAAIGVVLDGFPPNVEVDEALIAADLLRRKPGQSKITTTRNETEAYEIISGVFENKTTGAPICVTIKNHDQRSQDYEALKDVYRPSHADYTYQQKYGIRDYRGSGRASARETAARVIAGAFAKMYLNKKGIAFAAYVSAIGQLKLAKKPWEVDARLAEHNIVRCPDADLANTMINFIEEVATKGDSTGGQITCTIKGLPAGLGNPVFDKFHAELGKAILSINACKGFEIGEAFNATQFLGSQLNDAFTVENNQPTTKTNNSGGVQGGITNGEMVYFNCAFKPVSTIGVNQLTINSNNQTVNLSAKGRHDPCVVPRAVPIVEAMAAIVTLDFWLQHFGYYQ